MKFSKSVDLWKYLQIFKHRGADYVVESYVFLQNHHAVFEKATIDYLIIQLLQKYFLERPRWVSIL